MTTGFIYGHGAIGNLMAILNYIKRLQWTSGTPSNFAGHVFSYRQLHLLAKMNNNCYQATFFNGIMPILMCILITSMYALIMLHTKVPLVTFLYFALEASDMFIVLVLVYKPAGDVHEYSEKTIHSWLSWTGREIGKKGKLFRRLVLSCAPIKVKMSSVNFAERMTAFVVLDFCFRITIALSLVGNT